jgi:hypothetical protein
MEPRSGFLLNDFQLIAWSMRLQQPKESHQMVWRSILCLLFGVTSSVTCSALEIQPIRTYSGVVLRMRGDIKEGDYLRLKAQFKREKTIVGLDLSSDGGDLDEGRRIAELVRRKKLKVYVADECDSACADIFLIAASRYFKPGSKIGVHAISNDKDVEDVGSKLLTLKLARFWAKTGVPSSVIGKMVTTRPQAIAYLTDTDLSDLHALAGDPFEHETKELAVAGQPH